MMIANIIFILLAIAVSAVIVWPLLRARSQVTIFNSFDSNHKAGDLQDRKETIYAAIKDIEFDYQMGKLSEEDFKALRQQYKEEAVSLLKEIDKAQSKVAMPGVKKKSPQNTGINFCWICGTGVTDKD